MLNFVVIVVAVLVLIAQRFKLVNLEKHVITSHCRRRTMMMHPNQQHTECFLPQVPAPNSPTDSLVLICNYCFFVLKINKKHCLTMAASIGASENGSELSRRWPVDCPLNS